MRLTVLGGCGAWPAAGQACSGYLVDRAGVGRLIVTHLMPESSVEDSARAAAEGYDGPIAVASPGLVAGIKVR